VEDNFDYEVLKSAVEFEVLAARTSDPHIKAAYLKLARRYREQSVGEMATERPASANR
jgi:hypothetical protein